MKKVTALVLTGLLLLTTAACSLLPSNKPVESLSKSNFMMDTIITVVLYDQDATVDQLEGVFDEIRRLENLLSATVEDSDIARLNRAAGKEWVDIAPETEEVLRIAKEFTALSEGYFDITTGPLVALWNIHNHEGHYPTPEELAAVLPLTNADDLLIEEGRAYLAREGMSVNLGAIAKGFIADKLQVFLADQGIQQAALNLGRNLFFMDTTEAPTVQSVGVQDPNDEQGEILGHIMVANGSVVTSGINERYFEYQGQSYHHILDPFTGFPADTGVASVTILSESSAQGDALSTTCLLLGAEKGMDLIEGLDGVEALFVLTDGTLIPSDGFALEE